MGLAATKSPYKCATHNCCTAQPSQTENPLWMKIELVKYKKSLY